MLWAAALAFLVALAVLFLPLWLSIVITAALVTGYLLLAALQFDNGHIMNLIYPFLAILFAFIAALMIRYFTETRHRQRVSKLFAQYVPETVAQQLVEEGRVEQAAEGERLDVSLFFCDLRGFTAMSANLTPQQVRIMLNEFYDALTDIILEHKGTVLKFVGDEVFAVFGAPLPVEHHPQVTLDCAMAIQRAAPALSERLAEMDIPEVHFGIGMNSGEVVAAHVGGGKRRQYDIVGDTVNIGSRMCGQAGKGEIVMPIDCYQLLDDPPPAESMGLVALKNVEHPMELMRIRIDGPTETESPLETPREAPVEVAAGRCDNEGVSSTPSRSAPSRSAQSRSFDTVVFDFYGTLGHATQWLSLDVVLAEHGYELTDDVRRRWWFESEHDGIDHREHSHDEDAYAAVAAQPHARDARRMRRAPRRVRGDHRQAPHREEHARARGVSRSGRRARRAARPRPAARGVLELGLGPRRGRRRGRPPRRHRLARVVGVGRARASPTRSSSSTRWPSSVPIPPARCSSATPGDPTSSGRAPSA